MAASAFFLLADVREDHEMALQTARLVEKQRAAMLAGAMEALVVVAEHIVAEASQTLNAVAEAGPTGHGLVDGRVIKQVMVFDADGTLRVASPLRQGAEKVDCSGCRAFRELKEGARPSLFGAYYGDIPGSAGKIGFGQRLERPDGSFGGMVVAICDLGALVRDYGGEAMSVVLLTADQHVVAVYGTRPIAPGSEMPAFPHLAELPLGEGEVSDVSGDGVVAAVQRLRNYRLWVGVVNSLEAVDRRAAEDLLIGLGLIAGVAVAVTVFCVAAGVQIRRRRLAERSLSRARDELEQRVRERTIELEREIQDRKQIEATLRTTELRFQRFMENAPTGAHIVDADGAFLYVNRRFAEWLGVAPEDAIGKTCRDLLPESLAVQWERQDRTVDEDGPVSQELTFTLDGLERVWLADKFPLHVEPGTRWLAGVTADVSAHRAAEQELHHAQRMEVLGQLTSGVTHDLNNLLTVMLGNLEIVEDLAADAADIRQHVREAQWAARRSAHLTDRLLAMSRRRPPAAEVVDLNQVVEFMAELLCRSLGKEIDTAIVPAAVPAVVTVDVNRFENAVLNLCLNARDAMPQGGRLRVEVGVQTEFVSLSVADSGIGMPPEVAEHACDPFFTTKGLGKGTGLGLSMVKGFVGDSGGNLLIESEVAQGTKVILYFPRIDAEGAAGDGAVEDAAERVAALPSTVLVVEDEAEVRHLAVDALQRLGCVVREAEDAQAALAILETEGEVDLLFSDIVMPGGLSGVELAREVRRRWPQIRILLTSGFPGDAVDEDRDFWEFPVLRKPYDRQTLGRAVARRDGRTAEGCHDTDIAAAKV